MAPTGSANDAMNAPVNDGQTVSVSTLAELVDLLGEPLPRVAHKDRPRLGDIDRQWLAPSPFFLIAPSRGRGSCDGSPKGGPPGVAPVPGDTTNAPPPPPGHPRAGGH